MEANTAHVPSYPNATKVLNLTDYDFTTHQLFGHDTTKEVQCLSHNSYSIIREIDWEKDVHIAKFITRFILENEVKSRLMLPEYVVLEVPVKHRHIVEESLKETKVKVLYVKTEQVELEDGTSLDVKSIEHAGEKDKPKIILNLTCIDFTDKQIREVCDEDYELLYPAKLPELKVNKDGTSFITVMQAIDLIQEKFNEIGKYPDCVILDIPNEDIAGYDNLFQTLMNDVNIRRIYARTTFVEFVNGDLLEVKLLNKTEE